MCLYPTSTDLLYYPSIKLYVEIHLRNKDGINEVFCVSVVWKLNNFSISDTKLVFIVCYNLINSIIIYNEFIIVLMNHGCNWKNHFQTLKVTFISIF